MQTSPSLPRISNSTDATIGQPIVDRVLARKAELEAALARVGDPASRPYSDLSLALSTVEPLLSGDLAHVPAVIVADMNRWLERNKHLAQSAVA